ncbi:MAG: hypothetical protein JSS02_06095 [Planctomycetes bacterium]|nr:hypothetical protein [Planctomycetota bacterium]
MFRVAIFVLILVVAQSTSRAEVAAFAEDEIFRFNTVDEIWQDSAAPLPFGDHLQISAEYETWPIPTLPVLQQDVSTLLEASESATPGRRRSGGLPGMERAPFTARVHWMAPRPLVGRPGELGINGEEFELGYPVRIDEDGIWLAQVAVQRLALSTSVSLPDSGLAVPSQLWDIEAGMMHIRDLGAGKQAGGMLRIGSPSDEPFTALRDMTVTVLGFLTVPARDQNEWSFSVFYSPTGQIIFPIPGVAYVWRPNDRLQANLGVPFSIVYKPTDSLVFTANYMPLNNVQVLLRQSLGDIWSVYGGYRTVSETFLLAHRENARERTFLFDQRCLLGIQRELGRGWAIDLSAAYVFDRQFFQAVSFSGSRSDELLIDPGVAATLQFSWKR